MKRTFAEMLAEDPSLAERVRKCPPDPRQAAREAEMHRYQTLRSWHATTSVAARDGHRWARSHRDAD